MKIVHTESSLGWGGQEIRILSEAAGMIERGHQVQLLCPSQARIFQEAPRYNVPVFALPISRKNIIGWRVLRNWLKRHAVDIINTHSSTDSWLAALACATLSRPPAIVRTRHISAAIPQNWATRWLYQKASRFIVTTGECLRTTLIQRNGFDLEKIISIPTGINTKVFQPGDKQQIRSKLSLPENVLIIGIVATLRSWKGHRYLIQAFAQFSYKNSLLVIVGDGPQMQALQQLVDHLGLQNRCLLVGNQTEVAAWFQAMDIFALPSYANEGVPQALLQAMLTGLPCITTDAGSISEIAKHQDTAWIVAKESVTDILKALEIFYDDPDLAKRLAMKARQWCLQNYSREKMLDQMEEVFQRAAGNR